MRVRRVSAELRELRRRSGLALEDVARPLGFSVSHLSRVENGIRKPRPDDVGALLGFYRVPASRRDEMISLAREGQDRNWWLIDDGGFSTVEDFMSIERDASALYNYQSDVVPGLLQLPEYTRAFCKGVSLVLDDDDIEQVVNFRAARQKVLNEQHGPFLHAIFDEDVCRRVVGGPELMCRQLRAVVEAAASPKVTVQVIPRSVGVHPGWAGPFMLLAMDRHSDLVFTEDRCGGALAEDPHLVQPAKRAFWRLCALACSPNDSRDLIASIIDELSDSRVPGEEHGTAELARGQSR